jgi:thymidine phosphorylase
MTDWKSLNYVVVDVEGNGQQPPDLVEVAVVPIVACCLEGAVTSLVRWSTRSAWPMG